jgi:hypothetical protein
VGGGDAVGDGATAGDDWVDGRAASDATGAGLAVGTPARRDATNTARPIANTSRPRAMARLAQRTRGGGDGVTGSLLLGWDGGGAGGAAAILAANGGMTAR